jgi:hypothetical protein
MARDILVGSGALHMTFDADARRRDLSFPYVSEENHTAGHPSHEDRRAYRTSWYAGHQRGEGGVHAKEGATQSASLLENRGCGYRARCISTLAGAVVRRLVVDATIL